MQQSLDAQGTVSEIFYINIAHLVNLKTRVIIKLPYCEIETVKAFITLPGVFILTESDLASQNRFMLAYKNYSNILFFISENIISDENLQPDIKSRIKEIPMLDFELIMSQDITCSV